MSSYKWWLSSTGHAYTWSDGRNAIYSHRFITDCPEHLTVDHINNWKLDCRTSNLRVCTQSDNLKHKAPKRNSSSKFKGVSARYSLKNGNRFLAKIKTRGKQVNLGTFDSEVEAAIEYNKWAKIFHGSFAYLNPIMSYFDNVSKMRKNI